MGNGEPLDFLIFVAANYCELKPLLEAVLWSSAIWHIDFIFTSYGWHVKAKFVIISCFLPHLTIYKKIVTMVGGNHLTWRGRLPIKFNIDTYSTTELICICGKADRLYFSKHGCLEMCILSPPFPNLWMIHVAYSSLPSHYWFQNNLSFLSHQLIKIYTWITHSIIFPILHIQ